MIVYLDTSVLLAQLFAQDRSPAARLWRQRLVASRLLEYEVANRVHARGAAGTHEGDAKRLLARISLVEMSPQVLARALSPFPQAARTLDALHLATMVFLRDSGLEIALASYDGRLNAAARALDFQMADC